MNKKFDISIKVSPTNVPDTRTFELTLTSEFLKSELPEQLQQSGPLSYELNETDANKMLGSMIIFLQNNFLQNLNEKS